MGQLVGFSNVDRYLDLAVHHLRLLLFCCCCPYTDSGHYGVTGHNEVLMLRRMSEEHKLVVAGLLAGKDQTSSKFDALYMEPHDDGQVGRRVC